MQLNGHNGHPDPSYSGIPFSFPPSDPHESAITSFLYHAGFLEGNWSDVRLHVGKDFSYRMHKIILAQSPYLRSLLNSNLQSPNDIHLPTKERYITTDSILLALGYLYSPATTLLRLTPANSRTVLATAILLQLPKLCEIARDKCRLAIDAATESWDLLDWVDFTAQPNLALPEISGSGEVTNDGFVAPLHAHLLNHLITGLPARLGVFSATAAKSDEDGAVLSPPKTKQTSEAAQEDLSTAYSQLPFEIFKEIVESKHFPIGSDMDRFKFAKKCIAVRKKVRESQDVEEVALLSFGSTAGDVGNVTIVRKSKKRAARV